MPARTGSSRDLQLCGTPAGVRIAGLLATCAAATVVATTGATAQDGGAEAGGGGTRYVETPEISKVSCLRRCASRRRAKPGSTLRVRGSELSEVSRVTFHGARGRRDDATAKVRSGSSIRLNVKVPHGAFSGPVSATAPGVPSSPRTDPVSILPPPPPDPNPKLTPVPGPRERGAPRLETGTNRTKAFYAARRPVTFSYRVSEGELESVSVELVSARDGAVVRTWTPDAVEEDAVEKVVWNGRVRRRPAALGRYSFRLTVEGGSGEVAQSSDDEDFSRDSFDLYDHVFPVRGRHDYGGAGARFGAGRGGRSHQGHDVFARCGTPMVAARGGRVQYAGYHGAAGHYVVIDGAGTGTDYAYMHLRGASPFRTGDRVYTGQPIGQVGDSGNASGCHLHFEVWGAPGWYDGGSPVDPLPLLQAWDRWS